MFVSRALKVNEKNHLTLGGCDTVELAKEYGTPLYIYDEKAIRSHCKVYVNAIDRFYHGNGQIFFASKALCVKEMMRIAVSERMGVDVVSAGELYTAISAGVPGEKICMHGNNKTDEELEMALKYHVGHIVVDHIGELERLNQLAGEKGMVQEIMFRIKPGIDAHTHDFIMTGQIDSKFGVALETGEAMEFAKRALQLPHVKLTGIHCHLGSQIFELDPFREAARVMVNFIGDVKDQCGYEIPGLNLGGGFGVKYTEEDDPIEFEQYIEAVSQVVKKTAEERNISLPFIMMEPGRSIVGTAGITVYKIGSIKEISNVRTYLSVDGGMGDNPRYIMYESQYNGVLANRALDERTDVVTVAGKCCESGDILMKNVRLPKAEVGDYLAIFTTGAYNYSMASNYNRIPRPPIIMTKDGEARIAVKRESLEDLIRNDV